MKIKQAVEGVLAMGLSKVKVAELFGTNTKMVEKVIASDEGDYMVSKIMKPKVMSLGTGGSNDETS